MVDNFYHLFYSLKKEHFTVLFLVDCYNNIKVYCVLNISIVELPIFKFKN